MKKLLALLLTGVMVVSAAACGGSEASADPNAEASTELNIFMRQQYISDELIANFEAENNCTINLSYTSDNTDAVNKLKEGGGEYDLIMTSDSYMDSLVADEYVKKINMDKLPNTSTIKDAYWSSKSYCVPYLMNYIYVVYDEATCPVEITGYNDLLDPALKGQISAIGGARNLFPMALTAVGYDPNSTEEAELEEAYNWLVKFNENVAAYGNVEQGLINGRVSVAVMYDSDASKAMAAKDTLRIAPFTKDKVRLSVDVFVIPEDAEHIDLAEKFLNYICDPEVMAANLEEFPYSCPNEVAVVLASETYRNDPARAFDYKDNVFFQKDSEDTMMLYNDYYQKLSIGG